MWKTEKQEESPILKSGSRESGTDAERQQITRVRVRQRTCEKTRVLSFDRNVDLDKRFVPGKPLSLGRQSSGGKEFHSLGEVSI